MPKISVIIPVYKVEAYLPRCIDSVLAQTLADWEIVLVDDGSPDGSGCICDEYAAKDSRIKVMHQENAGVSSARNAGMDIASGEYLAFIDSDDFIDPGMYEALLQVAQRTNADVVECNYQFGQWKNEDSGDVYENTGMEALEKAFFQDRYGDGYSICPCTKLICRELYQKVRFLEGCSIAEDVLFCAELYAASKKVVKLDRTFYTYYQSENSAIRSEYRVRCADEVEAGAHLVRLMERTGNEKMLNFFKGYYINKLVMHWMKCYQLRDRKEFADKAKQLRLSFIDVYPEMKDGISVQARIKYSLFRVAPGLYYRLYNAYLKKKV